MGLFGGLFGGDDGGDQQVETKIPDFLKSFYQGNIKKFNKLYKKSRTLYKENKEFPAYEGQRVADFSPDELAAFDLIRSSQGTGAEDLDTARALVRSGTSAVSQGDIDTYLNPYTDEVITNTIRNMEQANDRGRLADAARATSQRAFGGTGAALIDAERDRNFGQAVGDTSAMLRSQGFDSAVANAQAGKARALQGAGLAAEQGRTAQMMTLQDINNLLAGGGMQRQQQQAGLDVAYDQFQQKRDYPYQQLGWLQSMLQGQASYSPSAGQTVVGGGAGGPSPVSGAAGGALAGYSVGGPWGAAIGGGLGLAGSLFNKGGLVRAKKHKGGAFTRKETMPRRAFARG